MLRPRSRLNPWCGGQNLFLALSVAIAQVVAQIDTEGHRAGDVIGNHVVGVSGGEVQK